jgi:hypothetical protein
MAQKAANFQLIVRKKMAPPEGGAIGLIIPSRPAA